jgi:nitrite reductase/ring-hydroxylating ferredoxin subunit
VRVKACHVGELPKGQCRVIKHERTYIALIHHKDEIHAIDDTCPHLGGSLGTGWLTEEGTIVCPWHGWEFRVSDGEGVWPTGIQVETFPVEVENDDVFVVVEDKPSPTTSG